MTLKVYVEQKFAVIERDDTRQTLQLTSLLSFTFTEGEREKKFENIEALLLDQDLDKFIKWVAKGLSGIPK